MRARRRHPWAHVVDDELVTLTLTRLQDSPVADELIRAPFEKSALFKDAWWTGTVKGPVEWCRIENERGEEVARARLVVNSRIGASYPSRPVPPKGATQIDLVEVRKDLRFTSRRGIGRQVVDLLTATFPPPFVLISLDQQSDAFWRKLDWREHSHPNGDERSLFELRS